MWTTANIPDQRGRVAVVTGANTGLGYETAKALAERGASVVLAVRDVEKGEQAAARIRSEITERVAGRRGDVTEQAAGRRGVPDQAAGRRGDVTERAAGRVRGDVTERAAGHIGGDVTERAAGRRGDVTVQALDLSSLDSVRTAADELRSRLDRIDLLINNAGVMYTPKQTTRDGFEMQFGTNHLGHFALTGLLLDRMLPVPGSRVVTVSSTGHRIRAAIHFDDLQWERSYGRAAAYGQSKLANLMFTYELQRRLAAHGTTVAVAAHPGLSSTELARNSPAALRLPLTWLAPIITQTPAMGALPTLRAATDPAVLGGQYYGPGGRNEIKGHPRLVTSSPQSYEAEIQRRLWTVSEDLTGVKFSVGTTVAV